MTHPSTLRCAASALPIATPSQVFAVLGVLNALQLGMTLFFPLGVQSGSELLASCTRVEVCRLSCAVYVTLPASAWLMAPHSLP
jgi:hypothetical protein